MATRRLVNQQTILKYAVAAAGVPIDPDEMVGTILLGGRDISVTDVDGLDVMVHMCKARWAANGFPARKVGRYDHLRLTPVVVIACEVPSPGVYDVEATLHYNHESRFLWLTIVAFHKQDELPAAFRPRIVNVQEVPELVACV